MDILVLVERIDGGYRARSGEPLGIMAEGITRDAAVNKARELLLAKMESGEVAVLHVSTSNNPLARQPGIWDKNDPMVAEWIEIMKENRRKADEDPDYL